MNRDVLPFAVALVLTLLWVYLSMQLFLRLQKRGVSWNLLKLRKMKLTGAQNFFGSGLLAFGVGTFIFDLSIRYVRWKLYGNPPDQLHFQSVIQVLFSALLGGVIFGMLSAAFNSK